MPTAPAARGLQALQETRAVFETGWPSWVLLLLGALAVAIWLLTWRNVRRAPLGRRVALLGLRSLLLLVVFGLVLEPAIQRREVTRVRNVVPVLLDVSRSMELPGRPGGPPRARQLEDWVEELQQTAPEFAEEHELKLLAFGDGIQPTTPGQLASGRVDPAAATRILEALEATAELTRGDELGGIVLVTDGADNGVLEQRAVPGEALPSDLEERLRALDVPVHAFIAGGRDSDWTDVAIRRVLHDDFAFVHNVVEMDVDLRVEGVSASALELTLAENGAPLQARTVELEPGRSSYRVTFSFTPARVGRHHYRVSAPELAGEAALDNNHRDVLIQVVRDRIRVLQVAGRPSWDERFLRRLLKKSPNVDLISFFILRTATNLSSVPSSELSLIPFPSRELFEEELPSFDIVVLQDFDYRPYNMRRYLGRIRDYVLQGGGLLMLGGAQSFGAGGYPGSEVEPVLPVQLPTSGAAQAQLAFGRYPLRLTDAGQRHPIMALDPDSARSAELWRRLPQLEGFNRVASLAPGAVVLGTAHVEDDASPAAPLLVARQVARGRSLALLTDSSWRWALPNVAGDGDLRPYTRFYNNAIRWLIQDPEQKQITLSTDRERYAPEEEVRVELRAQDASYRPAVGVDVSLRRGRPGQLSQPPGTPGDGPLPEAQRTDAEGRALWTLPAGDPGVWALEATIRYEGELRTERTLYLSARSSRELDDVAVRADLLEAVAQATSGTVHRLPEPLTAAPLAPARVLRVDRQDSSPLWNHPGVLLLAIGLFALEWWLRRSWGFQ